MNFFFLMMLVFFQLENENYEILSDERTETQHQEIHTQPPVSLII